MKYYQRKCDSIKSSGSFRFALSECSFKIRRLIQPICLGGLVTYFAQTDKTDITRSDAYWYATGIVLSTAFMVATYHPFVLFLFKVSAKLRVACNGLIYRKVLHLSKSSSEEGQNGKIINLISTDLAKFEEGCTYLHDVWKGPIETLVFFIVIYMEIGVAAFAGMAFMICFVPLQGKFQNQLDLLCL